MARLCARPACSQPAAATLYYDYDASNAWVEQLAVEPYPAGYDLCAAHAERLTVPQGWTRTDRRRTAHDNGTTPFGFADRLAV